MSRTTRTSLVFAFLVLIGHSAFAAPLTLKSGINGNVYTVSGQPGTAGILGVDYALGTYLAGGDVGSLGYGYPNAYSFFGGAFTPPIPPSGYSAVGAMEATDHNWLQGTRVPIVVDLGRGNASDQPIVFNSIDHRGTEVAYGDPAKDLWDELVEGIEFTVYGTNDLNDALAAASTLDVFGTSEAGTVPAVGAGSTFEKGKLVYVFQDGWKDFGNVDEGDDFASVYKFTNPYQYIAVYSNLTDPFLADGFQSADNELDAIGRFLPEVPEPSSITLLAVAAASLGAIRLVRRSRSSAAIA